MEESNYGHKGKNEETGFVLHMKKINFILYLYFGNIIYGIIEKSYNFSICLQAVTIHILASMIFIFIILLLFWHGSGMGKHCGFTQVGFTQVRCYELILRYYFP